MEHIGIAHVGRKTAKMVTGKKRGYTTSFNFLSPKGHNIRIIFSTGPNGEYACYAFKCPFCSNTHILPKIPGIPIDVVLTIASRLPKK